MAKNMVQFQKGLSLTRFLEQYGTEALCQAALFNMRWPNGFVCPKCGNKRYYIIKSRKVYQCHSCRFQTTLIQGTIFSATKLPIKIWFLAIYFMTQSKTGVSALSLARTLGISANAALRMKHKLQQVMKERDDTQPLNGLVLIDDAYWGGKKRDGLRGRGASGKMPFVAALSLTDEGLPKRLRLSHVHGFTLNEITSWSSKHLSPNSFVISDGLNCFPGVKDANCDHARIVTTTENGYDEFKYLNG